SHLPRKGGESNNTGILEGTLVQDQLKPNQYQVHVLKDRCKGCGFCIEFCPRKILCKSAEMNSRGYHVVDLDDSNQCSGCNICAMICPEFAITVIPDKEKYKKGK
ncbi:ferredoxin family protein, partial [Chloroflexota bacterium]